MTKQLTIFNQRICKGGFLTLLLCFILSFVMPVFGKSAPRQKDTSSKSSFENPDFAFPADVRRDAQPVFNKAMRDKDGANALLAAMELSVADRTTSSDSVASVIARFDRIADEFDAPWSSMALLLKAKTLQGIYSYNRGKFDSRVLPTDELNPEPMLWSGEQFRSQINSVLRKVFASSSELSEIPIGKIAAILTNVKDADEAGFSVLDFATYQAIGLSTNHNRSEIPFRQIGKEADLTHSADSSDDIASMSLINALIGYDDKRENEAPVALMLARVRKYALCLSEEPESEAMRYRNELLNLYPEDDPLRPRMLINLLSMGAFNTKDIKSARDVYEILKASSANASGKERDIIEGYMANIMLPSYKISADEQWCDGKNNQIVLTSRNIARGNLLLVPISVEQAEKSDNLKNKDLRATGFIRKLIMVDMPQDYPSERTDTIIVKNLAPGYYALVMSESDNLSGIFPNIRNARPDLGLYSNINAFASDASDARKDSKAAQYLYVTKAENNQPVSGTKVVFESTVYNQRGKTSTGVTDKDGKIAIPFQNCKARIAKEGNRLVWNVGQGYKSSREENKFTASVLTDLALYHPGDSIRSVAVITEISDNLVHVARNQKIKLSLFDANYKEVEAKNVVTDEMGRAVASFLIPADGLTGIFSIRAADEKRLLGSARVNVAEYVAPTFYVMLDKPELQSDEIGNTGIAVEFSGSAMTYSGVPIADAEVALNISFYNYWYAWRISSNTGSNYGIKIATDAEGRFSTTLVLSAEDARNYQYGRFAATAVATISAGETESSSSVPFTIGEGYSLTFAGNNDFEVTGPDVVLPVKVTDFLNEPKNKTLSYKIKRIPSENSDADFSSPDLEGTFESPNLIIPSKDLRSGLYSLQVILKEGVRRDMEDGSVVWVPDTLSQNIIIRRASDSKPPYQTSLWIPETVYYAQPGQKSVEITVGNSFNDNYVYCQIADRKGTIRREWLQFNDNNHKIKVDAPKDGDVIRLYFAGSHLLDNKEGFVTVLPPDESKKTLFRVDTFRDKLSPGTSETWRFRLMSGWLTPSEKGDGLSDSDFCPDAAVIAVLSNKALDAIVPFNWSFNPKMYIGNNTFGGVDYKWKSELYSSLHLTEPQNIDWSAVTFNSPEYRFGNKLFSGGPIYIRGNVKYRSLATSAGGADMAVVETEQMMMSSYDAATPPMDAMNGTADLSEMKLMKSEEVAEAQDEVGMEGDADASQSEDMELRDMEMPLAFFRPLLSTDAAGYATIEFMVPNFNTEWNLQLLGYDRSLHSALLRKSAVVSKPVMVSTSMPRFLTTGDKTQISVTVINNTEESLEIETRIEIFDLISGKTLFENVVNTTLKGNSTGQASIDFTVPDDYSQLGVRSVSRSDKGSDGEQSAILVLPSSTPVSDAITFYLLPGCDEKSVTLPKMTPTDKVTFNFCNNPEWFVLTALSGKIAPDSESALVQAVALYSNAVAGGLIHKNPKLNAELSRMIQTRDSILISPLQQNEDIRLASLNSTPWVNNAENETERMQSLRTLLDSSGMEKSLRDRIAGLKQTNNADGSWSWMKGMPGSEWITEQVVACLSYLRSSGYFPQDKELTSMLEGGEKYCDAEIGKEYKKIVTAGKGKYPLSAEVNYLYIRSNATSNRPDGAIADMEREMLRRLPGEWRELSVSDKAAAATLLYRTAVKRNVNLAKTILESVRQFATYSPDKGLWFDNVADGYYSPSPLLLAARCLDAYKEIDPANNAVDGLLQYLILSRQTQDWNLELGEAGVAYVANSVLMNADKIGLSKADVPGEVEVYLNEQPIQIKENGYLNLDPLQASGATLTVHRHGNSPAWGGVMCQYIAPIRDVKAHSVPQLEIKKELLPIEADGSSRKAGKDTGKFRKGDRVRVTLTLSTDRELDYLLITDRLGSWMQPSEQLTQYELTDGLWMLRETRKADVNFYITRIPKGKYIISYEVNAARDGEYSNGIASAQSQYYPMITAHSAGRVIIVNN